jgi:nucleotide-binding universal stress UspA family protein
MIEIKRVLCPIDFSAYSARALAYAAKMTAWYGARLRVLHVMPVLPPSNTNPLAETGRMLTLRNLDSAVNEIRVADLNVEAALVESSDTAGTILQDAESFDADLVVTGSHGRSGVTRAVLGSVVETLLHKCRRPVLAIPSHLDWARFAQGLSMKEIVCAVDFAAPSLTALAHALSIAEEADAHLTLLHVIEVPPELALPVEAGVPPDVDALRAEAEADALNRLRKLVPDRVRDYCTVETAVLEGGVSRQVLRLAANRSADLIVLGVHGRNALDLLVFGSNSRDIVRQASCPVLVVPTSRLSSSLRRVS